MSNRHRAPKAGFLTRRAARRQLRTAVGHCISDVLLEAGAPAGSDELHRWVHNESGLVELSRRLSTYPALVALQPWAASASIELDSAVVSEWLALIGKAILDAHRQGLSVRCYERV